MQPTSPVAVVGLDALGRELLERLRDGGLPAEALVTHAEAIRLGPWLDERGTTQVVGGPPWTYELSHMRLEAMGVLVLAGSDESVNVDAALASRRMVPDLPVLVRLDDPALCAFIERSVQGVEVFSTVTSAAPAAVALAEQLLAENPGRSGVMRLLLHIARDVVSKPSDFFLAALTALMLIVLPTAWYFSAVLDLSFFDAVYFVWVTILGVGYGDIHLRDASSAAKLVGMVVMLLGAAFSATMVGLIADALLTRRLGTLLLRVSVRMNNHVVVVGAGAVGAVAAELLHKKGRRVVVIEANPDLHNVAVLRSAGVPVIIGDATVDETLTNASAFNAGVVLALSNRDAVNLHVGLRLTSGEEAVPTVARIGSPEIARHVEASCRFIAISPTSTTVDRLLERVVALRAERIAAKVAQAQHAATMTAKSGA